MFAPKMAKNKCTAKRKYEDEYRTFLTEWESLYFFVEPNGKPFCLICQAHYGILKFQIFNATSAHSMLTSTVNFQKGLSFTKIHFEN